MLEVAIKDILEETTGLNVFPSFGTVEPPFLIYTHTPLNGGVVKESQIEVKIITTDFDYGLDVKKEIDKVLDMEGKDKSIKKNDIVLRSFLAGGGQLFNDSIQTWELSCIYIINWRCLNG